MSGEKLGWKATKKKTMSYRMYARYTYNLFDDFIKEKRRKAKKEQKKRSRSTAESTSVKTEENEVFWFD